MYYLIILAIIIGAIGYAAWFIFVVWIAKKAISESQRNLDQLLPNLEQLIQGYSNLPVERRIQQTSQIQNMLMQANLQMRQLNDISRQRYDLKVGELMGMASSAGIDFRPR